MRKKKALALASLSVILLASLAFVTPIPPVSANPGNEKYWVMYGEIKGCSDLELEDPTVDWKTPYQTRKPFMNPKLNGQNTTFSDPWELDGYGLIVNLTIPHESFIPVEHCWFDESSGMWYKMSVTLENDGYGWIFLNDTGDVDSYTYNKDTGVYWKSPSPDSGELAASTGDLPDVGEDGIAGTLDDGFGDGTNDTRGSSIALLNCTMHVEQWVGSTWSLLFDSKWPEVLTTGTASDIVNETNSELDGWGSTEEGEPWEFYAGEDHLGLQVPYGDPKWNVYVTYVCAWSVLNYDTTVGDLDVIFQLTETLVRDDVAVADIDRSELVDVVDLTLASLGLWGEDEGPGDDGIPETGDDKKIADDQYDFGAQADIADPRGLIDIVDLTVISLELWEEITP